MYFDLLPNIRLVNRPIKYPWSTAEYTEVKNIFRRFKITDSAFDYITYFNKYVILDGERPDTVSQKLYGTDKYDWLLLMVNNITNRYDFWPMSEYDLRKHVEDKYDNPEGIHHYETIEVANSNGDVILKEGIVVDSNFYNSPAYQLDTTTPGLPIPNLGRQATASVSIVNRPVSTINVTSGGAGYEFAPIVTINDTTTGSGATATANLSNSGYFKRFEITNPGAGYVYPPIVTLGGGLAGQSATASISNGEVTGITLDGIKFDLTNANQVYEFGNGTTIVPNGNGNGSTGGFNIGSSHLRFGGSSGTRFVTLNPINATSINTVRVYAVRGNGNNGGETPDIQGQEDLRIQYQITSGTPTSNGWTDLGIVIPAVPNGSGTGVLTNYDFNLPSNLKAPNIYFRLFQQSNSGADYDHYGILSVTFLGDVTVDITNPTITLTKNPLQTSNPTVSASASVVLGRRVQSVSVVSGGTNYNAATTSVNFAGGLFDTAATATASIGTTLGITLTDSGDAYSSATINLVGGSGTGATASISVANSKVSSVTITNQGLGYTTPPSAVISAPNNLTIVRENDVYTSGPDTWRFNGSAWEKKIREGYQYYDNGLVKTVAGSSVSQIITNYEYERRLNDNRREIYVLKKQYVLGVIQELREKSLYVESSDFISNTLKQSSS